MGVFNKPVKSGLELMMLCLSLSRAGLLSIVKILFFSLKHGRLLSNVLSIWLVLFSVL